MAKKRFGDRKDGRRLRTIDPMSVVSPYIMGTRSGCQNQLTDSFDTEECEKYLTDKKKDGVKGLSLMHIIIAAYLRTVSQYPAINRYIAGQRIYSRDKVIISLVIKRELKLESPDTVIKVEFSPRDTIMDVYEKFNKAIDEYRSDPGSSFDNLAKVLNFFPGLVLKFAIGTLRFMDYFGWLPYSLQKLSPFHASLFITSMGSLGIPAVCHHLYDFGNLPVFIAFGAKKKVNVLNDDGVVEKHGMVDTTFVLDERICDGYYFATAYKYLRRFFKNPALLELPPETVVEDIE
ncbi:MAG: hypothetical protein E7544_10040 [Ruminococcaceae bacterium]|nr:hypothetical protein [Oscillospiraceae bacterium]